MPNEFPLWRLRPEDAARIIILEPLKPVEHHKFWHKRVPRSRPSKRSAPRVDDLKQLDSALNTKYWLEYQRQWAEACPMIAVVVGPMLADGRFYSQGDRIANPLPNQREREPWAGMYSRAQFEADELYFEQARALNRENYILGQQHEGPYIDGLLYVRVDNLLLAEIDHARARLQQTSAILQAARAEKAAAKPQAKGEAWHSIGGDEAVAMKFKQSGYPIRKVGLHSYEVLMNPKPAKKRSNHAEAEISD